jgi:hypothetical protein
MFWLRQEWANIWPSFLTSMSRATRSFKPPHKVFIYKKADFTKLNEFMSHASENIFLSIVLNITHPRSQGFSGKDPGIVWSRDSTKINCPRGSGKVSNYMLPQITLNFKYQEWDFTIHSSKLPLTYILYFCLLLYYKNTVAFYQPSSKETNKIVYFKVWSWVFSLKHIFISNRSVVNVCIFLLLFVSKICH